MGTAGFFPFSLTHPRSGLGDASLHVTRQQGGSADVIPPPSLWPSQPPYCKAGKSPVFRPSLRSLSQQQRQTRSGTRTCFFTHCYYLLGCGLRHQSIIKTRKNTHGSWGSLRMAGSPPLHPLEAPSLSVERRHTQTSLHSGFPGKAKFHSMAVGGLQKAHIGTSEVHGVITANSTKQYRQSHINSPGSCVCPESRHTALWPSLPHPVLSSSISTPLRNSGYLGIYSSVSGQYH